MRRPFGVTFGSIFHAAAPKRQLGGSRNARVNEQVRGRGKPGGHQLIDLRPALVRLQVLDNEDVRLPRRFRRGFKLPQPGCRCAADWITSCGRTEDGRAPPLKRNTAGHSTRCFACSF